VLSRHPTSGWTNKFSSFGMEVDMYLKSIAASALSLTLALWTASIVLMAGAAQAQNYSEVVLHSLTAADGTYPFPGVLDKGGNLYTATQYGGTYNYGTVLKVSSKGAATVLYNFTGGSDGASPHAGLVSDASGNLYGTTFVGGANGYGTVYEVTPAGAETVLHNFSGGDGAFPTAVLTRNSKGTLYGTAYGGGANGYGVIFQLTPSGTEAILHNFTNGSDGGGPISTLLSSKGNLYGVTYTGGTYGAGTVFEYNIGKGSVTTLYSFTGGADGSSPRDSLSRNSFGTLFGTTRYGGAYGQGTVFSLDKAGNETVLYSFTGGADGAQPLSGVILDKVGNLYGSAWQGGAGCGVVFELSPSGSETVLYTFTGVDGCLPEGAVTRDSKGNLYGNAYNGGANGYGAVYKIVP
jgi:uncharacterized repeat protein (TIGR03803 family)